jgi:hypothetical protein
MRGPFPEAVTDTLKPVGKGESVKPGLIPEKTEVGFVSPFQ